MISLQAKSKEGRPREPSRALKHTGASATTVRSMPQKFDTPSNFCTQRIVASGHSRRRRRRGPTNKITRIEPDNF